MAEASSSLMESIKRLLSTLASIVSTRLELLANELQEERLHLTRMLVLALFTLFCFGIGVLLLTAFIVVLFWDEHRLAALGTLRVVFFSLGALTAVVLRGKMGGKSKLFSVSLTDLAKDREYLNPRHE